ncbi:MAG: type II toxin-antitoxin system VapC family toxin [Desulfurococcales archaeon]|nr:type II toxin-antitoxin system VapC family toxin [Desulfurococcales archaeon]
MYTWPRVIRESLLREVEKIELEDLEKQLDTIRDKLKGKIDPYEPANIIDDERKERQSTGIYVIDASVYAPLVATCGRDLVRAMRRLEFAVLDLTVYEVCNAFWREYRKLHKIIEGEAIQACIISKTLTRYTKLYRVIDLNIGEAMKIAVESNIAIYDSSYIALAHRLGATLSSEDQDI